MISGAIYKLLNVSPITEAVENISLVVGEQGLNTKYPAIVINETSVPENYKDNYKVINHTVQIDVYCEKTKDGNGGFLQAFEIAEMVENKLNRFSGTVIVSDTIANYIDTIYLEDSENLYDPLSQAARVIMTYRVREASSSPKANPTEYPVTLNFYVNDVLNVSQEVNAYENNTINITV